MRVVRRQPAQAQAEAESSPVATAAVCGNGRDYAAGRSPAMKQRSSVALAHCGAGRLRWRSSVAVADSAYRLSSSRRAAALNQTSLPCRNRGTRPTTWSVRQGQSQILVPSGSPQIFSLYMGTLPVKICVRPKPVKPGPARAPRFFAMPPPRTAACSFSAYNQSAGWSGVFIKAARAPVVGHSVDTSSASVQTSPVIPASIAGVTRKVLWIRQKL